MEFTNFIKHNQITNYEELEIKLNELNLKTKTDESYPDLILIYGDNNNDSSLKIIKECNGLIIDKVTLKIVCYTFDKCSDELSFDNNINMDDLYIETALEGTLMRLYCYNNNWVLSTKKCIDSSKSKWLSNRSFFDLFFDCIPIGDFYDTLNKDYCYSFILTHPENNIVINYVTPYLCHISTRDMNTLQEIEVSIGIPKSDRVKIDKTGIPLIMSNIFNEKDLNTEGVVFIDTNYNRQKIRTPIYSKARAIWGNTNNRFYRYLELRSNLNQLNEYLTFFYRDKETFIQYEYKIAELCNNILLYYFAKHVNKTLDKVPFYYTKIIYKLQGDYYKNKIKTDYNKIMATLLEYEPKQICFMMNNYEKSKVSAL